MTTNQLQPRPLSLIDEWMKKYGYDTHRTTSESAPCLGYVRVGEYAVGATEPVYRWINVAADEDPVPLFASAFRSVLDILKTDYVNRRGGETTEIDALLILTHGEGRWAVADPDDSSVPSREWDDLDDEFRTFIELTHPADFVERAKLGTIPCRIVNIISLGGLAADVTMFPPTGEPAVERQEQWVEECDPDSRGLIDDALMSTFTFIHLIQRAVRGGYEMSVSGLMDSVVSDDSDSGRSMMAFLLRLIASGVDSGMLEFGDEE